MSTKTVMYLANLAANTERGPSESIWGAQAFPGGWVADFAQEPRLGWQTWEDWDLSPNFPGGSYTGGFGRWAIFSTANGAIADDAIVGAGLRFKASTTADQGVTVGASAGAYQLITSAAVMQGRLAFEARVAVSTGSFAATTNDTFVGLMDNLPPGSQVPITNTGGILAPSTNFIGFHKRGGATNPADWSFVFAASGQAIQYPTNMQNLITTITGTAPTVLTYYKLGFVFEPVPPITPLAITNVASGLQTAGVLASPLVKVYVNGIRAGAFLIKADVTAATFPTGVMGPVFAFMQQSTTAGIYSAIDWIRVAQGAIA